MSEKLYVIKCSDCFITDNYCNIQEAYNNYGCAKARVDYFVKAGVPKESFVKRLHSGRWLFRPANGLNMDTWVGGQYLGMKIRISTRLGWRHGKTSPMTAMYGDVIATRKLLTLF